MPRDGGTRNGGVQRPRRAGAPGAMAFDRGQFIAGDAARGDAGKCVPGSPYCPEHRRLCVRRPLPFETLLWLWLAQGTRRRHGRP